LPFSLSASISLIETVNALWLVCAIWTALKIGLGAYLALVSNRKL